MNALVSILITIFVAMLTEIVMRQADLNDRADVAEATALTAMVTLAMQLAETVALPVYLRPFKAMLINPLTLRQLAKYLMDLSEEQIMLALKRIEELKAQQAAAAAASGNA